MRRTLFCAVRARRVSSCRAFSVGTECCSHVMTWRLRWARPAAGASTFTHGAEQRVQLEHLIQRR